MLVSFPGDTLGVLVFMLQVYIDMHSPLSTQ